MNRLKKLFFKGQHEDQDQFILPLSKQIKSWHRANRKMAWGIPKTEFEKIEDPPLLTKNDTLDGFVGVILSYGFGEDGQSNADPLLSGKLAWEYGRKCRKHRTWQCEHFDFDKADRIRLRPKAPPRPKGFYYTKFQPGERYKYLKVSQLLKRLNGDTGCGPEGIQLLTITHTHLADMMNDREIPFMAFADYDIAPHGYNDFFDSLQMFCSNDILGLGIGNVDFNYPLFGIPTLRF